MPCSARFVPLVLMLLSLVAPTDRAHAAEKPKSALLVVDAQVNVLASVWESERVVANIEALVASARKSGTPVIWVQHSDEQLVHGSDGWKLAPTFVPARTEPVIHKKFNSSFANTELEQRLKALRVKRIVLAGAATNWCIRSTAYAALERGYDLTLVSDAHSTESIDLGEGRSIPAESVVQDLNTVMQWVSVPNVRTQVVTTREVAF